MIYRYLLGMVATNHDKTGPYQVGLLPTNAYFCNEQFCSLTGKEEEEIVRQLRQRVAILLVRDNVNMFDSRTPSFPQAFIDADVDNNV